jgi:hypothetical protein
MFFCSVVSEIVRSRTLNYTAEVFVLTLDFYLYIMIQQVIVIAIFIVAVAYIGRLVYKSFQAKSACDSGCGKCGAVDFNKIEKQLKEKGI